MAHKTFKFHFVVPRDEGGLVRVVMPIDIPVLRDTPYATVDNHYGKGVVYYFHKGNYYGWEPKGFYTPEQYDADRLAAILKWEEQPKSGSGAHPLAYLNFQGMHIDGIYSMSDLFSPPEWTHTTNLGGSFGFSLSPRKLHGTEANIYKEGYGRQVGASVPDRPTMLKRGEKVPTLAHQVAATVQAAVDRQLALIGGRLVRVLPEPVLVLQGSGGHGSLKLTAEHGSWMVNNKMFRAVYALTDHAEAIKAAKKAATRFGCKFNDDAVFKVHSPGSSLSWKDHNWMDISAYLPKEALKMALDLPDAAVMAACEMLAIANSLADAESSVIPSKADITAARDEWIACWIEFQKAFGDRADWQDKQEGKVYVLSETVRCCLSQGTPVPKRIRGTDVDPVEYSSVVTDTVEFLPLAGKVFVEGWLALRRARSDDEIRVAKGQMSHGPLGFATDAARKRWRSTGLYSTGMVRDFFAATFVERKLEETIVRIVRHVTFEVPAVDEDISILVDHVNEGMERMVRSATNVGWNKKDVLSAISIALMAQQTKD